MMLTLNRRSGESVIIGHEIEIIVHVKDNQVRMSFHAPKDTIINRKEVYLEKYPEIAEQWLNKKGKKNQ